MRNLAQLASRLFLPIGVGMGECLNDENEGDEGQGNSQHPDQILPADEAAPHPRYTPHPDGSLDGQRHGR